MRIGFQSLHCEDHDGAGPGFRGKPSGGQTCGTGFTIAWQRGALEWDEGGGPKPNGAFIEDVIAAAADRLQYHQTTQFACDENRIAIDHLNAALAALEGRTKRRKAEGKLGGHEA